MDIRTLIKDSINYDYINNLYIRWLNEENLAIRTKLKEKIEIKVSKEEFLLYSIKDSIPFKSFRNIFSLIELFKALEKVEKRGCDITEITNKTLLIRSLEDIQGLNQFCKNKDKSQVENFRLKFSGSSLFEIGDFKKIGKKFPYACVNFIDIAVVETLLKTRKDYKGVPIIVTIDNIGELSLKKLAKIEQFFDVLGVRIVEKGRDIIIEQKPIMLSDYKKVRTRIDKDIIEKLYVTKNASKVAMDYQLTTQVLLLISDKIEYDSGFKSIHMSVSDKEYFEYYSNVSNILGIITGKSICGGYAEIVRNVLNCVGIRCKTIVGMSVDGGKHAWNQVQIGEVWFNLDLSWSKAEIQNLSSSGYLFMSDIAFFGKRRKMIFDQGKYKNGESMEFVTVVGGHISASNNAEKCDYYISPHITELVIKEVKMYASKFQKCSDNNSDVILYVGSNAEKLRLNAI